MKWNCERCKAINPQFGQNCHNCGFTEVQQLSVALSVAPFSQYVTCPFCRDEDATEETESEATACGKVKCKSCTKEFGAIFDEEKDGFFCSPIFYLD